MKIGIAGNKRKPHIREAVQRFIEYALQRGIAIVVDTDLIDFLPTGRNVATEPLLAIGQSCDFLAAFGGDGTLLTIANQVATTGIPILGVNLGGLGFLAEVPLQEIEETIDDLCSERYTVIDRMMLQVHVISPVHEKEQNYYALNDVVIDKGTTPRLVFVDVRVDEIYLNTYRCDGVIIATPTGSTAYSLSAGGPLLMPTMKAIIVTPICPHSLTVRPIVLSDTSRLRVRLLQQENPAQINIDGKNLFTLHADEALLISKAPYTIHWVATHKRDFFSLLRSKLNWGVDLSSIPQSRTTSGC